MKDLLLPFQSVEELIVRTKFISCANNRLSLSPSKEPLNTTKLSLIGKIISPRNFINSVVQEIIVKAWKPSHPIQVKRVDRNNFVFSFGHEVDRQLAFNRRPWTIKGAHLILKIWSPELSWQEIAFSSSTFWIQIHGLPRLWQYKENLIQIGQQAGKVLDIDFDCDHTPQWRKFFRARIEVDINSPLKPGIFLPRSGLPDFWISLNTKNSQNYVTDVAPSAMLKKSAAMRGFSYPTNTGSNFQPLVNGYDLIMIKSRLSSIRGHRLLNHQIQPRIPMLLQSTSLPWLWARQWRGMWTVTTHE